MIDVVKQKQVEIDNFVDKIMEELENKKIDLAHYEYLLGQLKNKIEFYLRFQR
ncbi:hypothetical protein FSBG_01616 [Fusobacterium gonidiaformans 3-1-5R]|uniref:Uncharacterized protein n=1 Tax=Fusobacterium gonidiaformans 3-1-5R TaxID=469605 RepID=E5BHZ6_9FUSO|nr:hypothetical protein [Fusobacterium gonidiaformans]EFS22119.1 hypothetical protein FSBG_01616 [Fusobacterium gonidiaformans 3-1-5R]